MSPAQYGEHLASAEPPLSDAQVEAAARLLATSPAIEPAAA